MNIICKVKFGSHLYGTASEDSDLDYKGIYMPSLEDILLGKVSKSINLSTNKTHEKNSKDDVDIEFYSLHYFIHLACEGETVALDMLHAPDNMIVKTSGIWKVLQSKRNAFYTKNLKAFIGYARRQASKYGIKGSRLNDAKKVLDFMYKKHNEACFSTKQIPKLKDIWHSLPEGKHIFKNEDTSPRIYEVCGRKLQDTTSAGYCARVIETFYDNYGQRAKQAADNKGIDWKAVSHALRAAFQVKEILLDGVLVFPLKEANYLKKVKNGELDYQSQVAIKLDDLMDEVEELAKNSNLPMKVDKKYWDEFIIREVFYYYDLYKE